MTINIALEQEQQQRVENDLIASNEQTHEEARLNTEVYSTGYLEGYWGCEPSQVGNHSYWAGYQIGCRERTGVRRHPEGMSKPSRAWAKKLGVEIPTEF